MAKTIVFKPEFEKKLKDLRIKTKFVKNFKMKKWPSTINNGEWDVEIAHKYCLSTPLWFSFIRFAFNWDITPEGYGYWYNIANS